MKKILLILSLIFTFYFIGCGASKNSSDSLSNSGYGESTMIAEGFKPEVTYDSTDENNDLNTNLETTEVIGEQRKIIKRAEVYVESLEFDKALEILNNNITTLGGYIEASDVYQGGIVDNSKIYRSANFTIRVPKDKFDSFLDKVGNIGVITNKNISGEDISNLYFDKESRLKVLKAQEERYIELISKANNITEILEVEKYLTEVRIEIESITGYLTKMDSLIDYSTVNINIQEVKEASIENPDTLGGKIVKTFKDSIHSLNIIGTGILLTLIAIFPYLIIFIVLGALVYIVYKNIKGKNKK